MRKRITLKPMRWRCSRVGSAAQLRKVTTSCAICGTVAGVLSANLTWSGQSGVVRRARRLVVGERAGDRVGRPARPLKHLAAVVGPVGHLDLRSDAFDLVLAVADLGEVAEREVLHRVAGGADLLVDLKAALQRGPVIGPEHTLERPDLMRRARRLFLRTGGSADED